MIGPAPSRRIVLLTGGAFGTGLVLGIAGCSPRSESETGEIGDWLRIAPDGAVTIRVNATDLGQGAQTGLAQIVADELDADWSTITVELAPVTGRYLVKDGGYYTGGSSSIRPQFEAFRLIGATARAVLVAAAANEWSVDASSCTTEDGFVRHAATGRSRPYGALAPDAGRLPLPASAPKKSRAQRRLIGKSIARLDIPEKVDGRAVYGIDTTLPGLRTATLVQCPYFGGRLESVDEAPARTIKGVEAVVKLENAVVVIARSFQAAKKGLDALAPRWTRPDTLVASNASMMDALRANVGAADSTVVTLDKSKDSVERVRTAFASAAHVVEAEYSVPLLAHACMEPQNATARVTASGCELWAPMQDQKQMHDDVANALGIPASAVVLHTTRAGGGFGRRLETDYGVLAARVAKIAGTPIKLIWSREEDFTHDFYRPASIGRVKAALDANWHIEALEYVGATTNDTAIGGFARNYSVANAVIRQKRTPLPFKVGAWRSVDPSITIFFIESLVDEIAHAANLDPLTYRRLLLGDNPRGLRVLDAVAEMSSWGQAPAGRARGVAFMSQAYWGTALAEVVELSVDNGKIAVHRVYCAIDPGTAVNPGAIEAQVQGGIGMGLSAALGEAISFRDGRVEQTNFDRYPILKLHSAPEIEVRVLETPDAPIGGVGEPPVPPAAPALANAIFAATGKRIRSLPIVQSGFSIA
jgi:isoquinoline 1-oxidoreductase beta subunit